MIRRFLRVIAPLLALAGGAHAQQTPWPERFYNPAPLEDDLVLPLPCGGAMAFRPVATPPIGGDALSDRSILLGRPEQIIESLKKVEKTGIEEVILYFNVGNKPHAMVKEQMHRFMEEIAPHFEGKHRQRRGA